jgi:small GTP-binding protein
MDGKEVFNYDVFLSHCTKDKHAVRELAERLKRDGLRVWFSEWEIHHGDLVEEITQKGLEYSRVLLLCMSQTAFSSEWATMESGTFQFRDPTNKERRFIPLRLDDAEPPLSLKQFAFIDWQQRQEEQYTKLLVACQTPSEPTKSTGGTKDQTVTSRVLSIGNNYYTVDDVAIAHDGKRAVSGFHDGKVRVWDLDSGKLEMVLEGHSHIVTSVAISADGWLAVSGSRDKTVIVWNLFDHKPTRVFLGHRDQVNAVALSSSGNIAVSVSERELRIWNLKTMRAMGVLTMDLVEHRFHGALTSVAMTEDGKYAISGCADGSLLVWNLEKNALECVLQGHLDRVTCVAMSADGLKAVSGSADKTLKVWDVKARRVLANLEGHTQHINQVSLSRDCNWLVSCSEDLTIRVWSLTNGQIVFTLEGHTGGVRGVAMGPTGKQIVSGSFDGTLRVWNLPDSNPEAHAIFATKYTNAKVLLVGESGVGKTGLVHRLTEGQFKTSISTDAAWATQLRLPHAAAQVEAEREIWLWDFAGQADYRLIHQLYLDETALAVLVFNPQSENPFEGVGQWDSDLQRAARRPFRKLLVAGRCDRGGLMISRDSVERFRQERGFAAFIETSALQGTGCDQLRDSIIEQIQWEDIPWTASPRIFRLLKDEIVKLKDEGKVLLRQAELRQQLELRLPEENFKLEQLRAVIGLLAGPGVVWQLEFGDFILLQPERINSYAAAVIRSVRLHSEEIGCIAEEDVLAGKLDFQDMKRLQPDEEQIVLRAMHQTFVDHGLCLREHTEKGTMLIFPSYFKRERPGIDGHPLVLVTYQFNGPLDEIYATLVVRLHHTAPFDKDRLWRFAADFKTHSGKRLGLKMTKKPEGAGEMEVYFEAGIANDVQVTFIRYIHDHLMTKARDVRRIRNYLCPHCGHPVKDNSLVQQILNEDGKSAEIRCQQRKCEKRFPLWDLVEEKFASEEYARQVSELEDQAKAAIDNESRELILVGHTYAIAGEAGQIYRQYSNSDHGIDGEIEFKDSEGKASGQRLYLQLKSGDSYLFTRQSDGAEVFTIKNERHADYWQRQEYPVMLVIRTSDGTIRWMDISEYLKRERRGGKTVKQVMFTGEPLTALNLRQIRARFIRPLKAV